MWTSCPNLHLRRLKCATYLFPSSKSSCISFSKSVLRWFHFFFSQRTSALRMRFRSRGRCVFQLHRPRLVSVDELPALALEAAQMCNMSLTLFQKFVHNLTQFFFWFAPNFVVFLDRELDKIGEFSQAAVESSSDRRRRLLQEANELYIDFLCDRRVCVIFQ